jgi:DNA-binding transcriptional ArsR family regulator
MSMPAKALSPEFLELIARRFKALSEPARLRILNELRDGERTVTELVERTGLGQTNVSKHLKILHGAGLLARTRRGGFVYYAFSDERLYMMCEVMCDQVRRELATWQEAVA